MKTAVIVALCATLLFVVVLSYGTTAGTAESVKGAGINVVERRVVP